MNKVKSRALFVLILVAVLISGLCFYIGSLAADGSDWVSFFVDKGLFSSSFGTITDRNGALLTTISDGKRVYSDDAETRMATLHAVGDRYGNIGTSAIQKFASRLIGYNFFNGVYSVNNAGTTMSLTIDSQVSKAALQALDGRSGAIMVWDYTNGDILCMVSSPTFDPDNPPDLSEDDTAYQGVYMNRCISAAYTPGSTFKIITSVAAIEQIPDIFDRTFYCGGSCEVGGQTINCMGTHGNISFKEAFAHSCNCAFAQITLELGGKTLAKYADQLGLTESFEINGISTASGRFDVSDDNTAALAWSGIGQSTDLVVPAAMVRVCAAAANGGIAVEPTLIKSVSGGSGLPQFTGTSKTQLMSKDTAAKLYDMMTYNFKNQYGGETNYPGLSLGAKSGTAQISDEDSHAWFVGFSADADMPVAFAVVIENGGSGSQVAGKAANTVLQAVKNIYGG